MNKIYLNQTKQNMYEPSKNTIWGFNGFSEKINGRAAMVGFTLLLLIEIITKTKLLDFIL